MSHEQGTRPGAPPKARSWRTVGIAAAALVIAFLAGFAPTYVKAKNLESELQAVRRENSLAQLRDLASLAYIQATRKDYGLAAGTTTRLFDRTREMSSQTPDPAQKQALESLMGLRDQVTAKLAVADPAAISELQTLLVTTRDATTASTGQAH